MILFHYHCNIHRLFHLNRHTYLTILDYFQIHLENFVFEDMVGNILINSVSMCIFFAIINNEVVPRALFDNTIANLPLRLRNIFA